MNLTSLDRELDRCLKRYNTAAHNYKLSNKRNRDNDLKELEQSLSVLKEAVLNFSIFVDNEKEMMK